MILRTDIFVLNTENMNDFANSVVKSQLNACIPMILALPYLRLTSNS